MLNQILAQATIPEHSLPLMQTMSGGEPFTLGNYLFFAKSDWLLAIGYPLVGEYQPQDFRTQLNLALKQTKAIDCFGISPALPPDPGIKELDQDLFYILPCSAPLPKRLKTPLKRASACLEFTETRDFTAKHRQLWAEFMGSTQLKPQVAKLFAQTEKLLQGIDNITLLNAWDKQSQLAACLVLDFNPQNFCSYTIGAHSKQFYTPYATDFLFSHMLRLAQERNKNYIHLGLGVNAGITRFKLKWGGLPAQSYSMWQYHAPKVNSELTAFMTALASSSDLSKRQILASLPEQKPFAMLWSLQPQAQSLEGKDGSWKQQEGNLEKQDGSLRQDGKLGQQDGSLRQEGKLGQQDGSLRQEGSLESRELGLNQPMDKSYLAGTAHFFCYSFQNSLEKLFNQVDTVIFEGPLDSHALNLVQAIGQDPHIAGYPEGSTLAGLVSAKQLKQLKAMVQGPQHKWAHFFNYAHKNPVDVDYLLNHTRHWYAFFSLWTGFLARQGWEQSVDLEAYNLAIDMGKTVISLESIPEQIASLELAPIPRIINFINNCQLWPKYIKRNVKAYLAGDLLGMLGTSTEFPSRTEQIIDHRDQRFRERMAPFIKHGRAAVFVGAAHLLNLRPMLQADGFKLQQVFPRRFW